MMNAAVFEHMLERITTHPVYVASDEATRRQIDAILRFARTSPDRQVYTSRLFAALEADAG